MALPDGESAPRSPSAARRLWRRVPVYARIASFIAVASIIAFFVTSSFVSKQQTLLLHSEATQSAAFIASELDGASAVQDALATATGKLGGSTDPFLTQATASVHSPLSVALVEDFLGHFTVLSEVGSGFRVGGSLSPPVIAAFQHPGTAAGGSAVSPLDGGTFTTWVGQPVTPKGLAVYAQLDMAQILAHAVSVISVPGLSVSVYDSSDPHSSTLLAGRDLMGHGHGAVATARVSAVDAQWAVAVRAASPITGALGTIAPIVVLLLGLSVALAVTLLGVLLHQRRLSRRVASSPAASNEEAQGSEEPAAIVTPVPTVSVVEVARDTGPPPDETRATAPLATAGPVGLVGPGAQQPRNAGSAVRGVLRPTATVLPRSPDPTVAGSEGTTPLARHAHWRPDPFGRHELRRFFLGAPTSVVRNGTTESYDPVPHAHGGHRVADEQLSEQLVRSTDRPAPPSGRDTSRRDQGGDDPVAASDPATAVDADSEVDSALEVARELDEIAARVARTIKEELGGLHLASLDGEHAPSNGSGEPHTNGSTTPDGDAAIRSAKGAIPSTNAATPSVDRTEESLVAFLRRTQSGRR